MAPSLPVGWKSWSVVSCIVAVCICVCVSITSDYLDQNVMSDLQIRINKLEANINKLSDKDELSNDVLIEPRSGYQEELHRVKRNTNENKARTGKKANKKNRQRQIRKHKQSDVPMSLDAVHFTAESLPENHTLPSRHGEGEVYDFWKAENFGERQPAQFIRTNTSTSTYKITGSGLYFIYAQVMYQDKSGRHAFGIFINDKLAIQCTQTQAVAHVPLGRGQPGPVFIQCHTAAVLYIRKGQRVYLKGLYEGRQVLRKGSATFWGIIKFSN